MLPGTGVAVWAEGGAGGKFLLYPYERGTAITERQYTGNHGTTGEWIHGTLEYAPCSFDSADGVGAIHTGDHTGAPGGSHSRREGGTPVNPNTQVVQRAVHLKGLTVVYRAQVWRYLSPAILSEDGVSFVRQGDSRMGGRFNLFKVTKYETGYAGLQGHKLVPGRYLEA